MEDKNLHSHTDQQIETENEREIFDFMRIANADFMDTLFTFKNVLIAALVLGIVILLCYGLGG